MVHPVQRVRFSKGRKMKRSIISKRALSKSRLVQHLGRQAFSKRRNAKGWTRRSKSDNAAHEKSMCEKFNAKFPVGTRVVYWSTLPFGPAIETRIRHGAWILASGDPVCKVDGVAGGVSIFHIREVN